MFRKLYFLLFVCILSQAGTVGHAQQLPSPAPGKAMVLILEAFPGSAAGSLLKFTYFDSAKYLGRTGIGQYLSYECEPGRRLFWVHSGKNRFLEAQLAPDQLYIIYAVGSGYMSADVQLIPFDPKGKRAEKMRRNLPKLLLGRKEVKVIEGAEIPHPKSVASYLKSGMKAYTRIRTRAKMLPFMTPDMHF